MKILSIEPRDLERLGYEKITNEEAIRKVSAGKELVVKTSLRDLYSINTLNDVETSIERRKMGIYEVLEFYAETTKY